MFVQALRVNYLTDFNKTWNGYNLYPEATYRVIFIQVNTRGGKKKLKI